MKRKFKFMLAGVLALGLLIAGTASALAGPTADSIQGLAETNEMTEQELGALVAELEEADELEIIPRPEDENAQVKILGGFHGRWGVDEAEALTIVNVANKLRNNNQEPMVVSTRHTLMIAEMVAVGATVSDAFINSLQMSRDVIESVLLSLHVELGLRDTGPPKAYELY